MRFISQRIINYASSMRVPIQVSWIQAIPYVTLLMLFLLCLPAFSEVAHDFSGTVLRVSDQNGLYVNVTQPGTTGLRGNVEVLLKQPLPDLNYFIGSELQFDILGHDILGRPVCDAYLAGSSIQDVYYCKKYPDLCALYGSNFRSDLIGRDYPFYYPYYYPSYYPGGGPYGAQGHHEAKGHQGDHGSHDGHGSHDRK